MKFSVGYQLFENDSFIKSVEQHKDGISEVYFAFGEFPNGRGTATKKEGINHIYARQKQECDLDKISQCGIGFNLLLNGNCYGKNALSRALFSDIGDTIDYLSERYQIKSVTTTSPLIAKFIKQNFEFLEVRASVNMEIGTVQGMDYLAEWFDSFYLKREYNRDAQRLFEARQWCDRNGKKLFGLANSGCLNECSAHVFHDNLVAHENEIAAMDNAYDFEGQCFTYLTHEEKRSDWLKITNFIRPEDVPLYEGLFDGLKLATRVNSNPCRVIEAYLSGSYRGSLPDLLEPNHAGLFYPLVVENKKMPNVFANHTLHCEKRCEQCDYCRNALKNALVNIGG